LGDIPCPPPHDNKPIRLGCLAKMVYKNKQFFFEAFLMEKGPILINKKHAQIEGKNSKKYILFMFLHLLVFKIIAWNFENR
jgi:hypothetical protein